MVYFNKIFSAFAEKAASRTGTPLAFILALSFIVMWVIIGPFFRYSQLWQLILTMVPTLITFLLVFLIQNSQNRETKALQLKLNELIRATEGAHTTMMNLEKLSEEELLLICGEYELLAKEARKRLRIGETDKGVPEIPLRTVQTVI